MSPTSGPFRTLCGAAVGYGLTDGGPNAAEITLTAVGRRLVSPLQEGDDDRALKDAALAPTVEKKFLEKYDGSPLPSPQIAANVLEALGVPHDRAAEVFVLVNDNAELAGLLKRIKDKVYVDLGGRDIAPRDVPAVTSDGADAAAPRFDSSDPPDTEPPAPAVPANNEVPKAGSPLNNRRVFISHGKTRRVVEQLKELLAFGDFTPVVSAEMETVSKPVPQKVMDDMRSCSAGIIHVKPEAKVMDQAGAEHVMLNENVLIEIGAAMALYREKFILLVESGAALPSNLQGLYEVRYEGTELGYEATMKLLKALNDFKASP